MAIALGENVEFFLFFFFYSMRICFLGYTYIHNQNISQNISKTYGFGEKGIIVTFSIYFFVFSLKNIE